MINLKIKNSAFDNLIISDLFSIFGALLGVVMLGRYHALLLAFGLIFIIALLLGLIVAYRSFFLGSVPLISTFNLFRTYWKLRTDLYDSAIYSIREYHNSNGETIRKAVLPQIKFELIDNNEVRLKIANRPNYELKLTNLNFSSSLIGWVVNNKYLSSDNFWMIYNLTDENCVQRHFTSYEQLENWMAKYKLSNYSFVIDDDTIKPLQSLYIFGVTGSGKSFFTEMILEELLIQKITDISVCDPKNSDLAVMAQKFNWRFSVEPSGTIKLLQQSVAELEKRQAQLNQLMVDNNKISKTYFDFGLKPKIVVVDELSALIALMNKKEQLEFISLIKQIVLKGRQLGIYVILIQQKYLSTDMPTSVKENCGVILMGKNGAMTQQTTFNQQLMPREMPLGSGYIQTPSDIEPRFFYSPFCDFNVLDIATNSDKQ